MKNSEGLKINEWVSVDSSGYSRAYNFEFANNRLERKIK